METRPEGPSSILNWKSEGVIAPSEHGTGTDSFWASQGALVVKNLPATAGYITASIPGSARFLWRRKWQPTLVFLPGEFHRQRRLAGYSPWSPQQVDMTEQLTMRNYRSVFQNCHTILPSHQQRMRAAVSPSPHQHSHIIRVSAFCV